MGLRVQAFARALVVFGASAICVRVWIRGGAAASRATALNSTLTLALTSTETSTSTLPPVSSPLEREARRKLALLLNRTRIRNSTILKPLGYPSLKAFVAKRLKEHENDFSSTKLSQRQPAAILGSDIYVLGNGDMTEEQHLLIRKAPASNVFRYNYMLNLRDGEPVGNLFARYATGPAWYNNLFCCIDSRRKCGRVAEAKQILLTGGGNATLQEKYVKGCAARLPRTTLLLLPNSFLNYRNLIMANRAGSGFSSGFTGISFLETNFPNATVHVMGMNWGAGKPQRGHDMMAEENFLRSDFRVSVHETLTREYKPNFTKPH